MNGKIAHLPQPIQEQLNRRLDERQRARPILAWLNSLPEVQAVLKAQFDGVPISPQNLSQHRGRGFLDWQARQQALEFAANLNHDDSALQSVLPDDLADKLSRYHDPKVENITNALLGIHRGLLQTSPRANYQGVAIYCEWETSNAEWDHLRQHFLQSK